MSNFHDHIGAIGHGMNTLGISAVVLEAQNSLPGFKPDADSSAEVNAFNAGAHGATKVVDTNSISTVENGVSTPSFQTPLRST